MNLTNYIFTTLQLGMILVSVLSFTIIIALAWPKGQLRSFILKILTAGACTAYIVWPVDGLGDLLFVVGDDVIAGVIGAVALYGAFCIVKDKLSGNGVEQKAITIKKASLLGKAKSPSRSKKDIGNCPTELDLKKTNEIKIPA